MDFPNYLYSDDGKSAPLIFNDINKPSSSNNNNNNNNNLINTNHHKGYHYKSSNQPSTTNFIDTQNHNSVIFPTTNNNDMINSGREYVEDYINSIYGTSLPFINNQNNDSIMANNYNNIVHNINNNNFNVHNFTFFNFNKDDTLNANNSGIGSEVMNNNNNNISTYTRADLEQYLIFNVAYMMNRYYLWVVFALGFPGNIVSFVTILKMKPLTSPTMYIAGLAFVDNTCLVCKMLFLLLTKHNVPLGDNGCGVLIFLGVFTAQLANWLLVAMTVERCLAICLPLKVGSICTKKVHILALVVMFICLTGINAQNFVTNKMFDQNGDLSCHSNPEYADFMKIWLWVDAVFYAILPATLLIVMNTLLVIGIRRSTKVQRSLTSKASQAAESMRQQRQITIILVIVCITFVLLITPNALFYAIKPNWNYQRSALETARHFFTEQVIFVLCDSTHAVNFYLYFFSTKRFRTRCIRTIFFCCYSKHGNSSSSANHRTNTNCYRMSFTEVTTVPSPNNVPMQHYSSSSSSSSASSMGRGGRHSILRNGGSDDKNRYTKGRKINGRSKDNTKFCDNNSKRYALI